jgi:tRNA A-37 threonylcarbamoyl transferase component Bud32
MSFSARDFTDWCLLADGGEAEVFRARQASLDRLVAIKRLKLSAIGRDDEIRRFEREAKLFASLSHPSLVQIHDYGRDERYYYQVMEFVDGADLGRLAGASGRTGLPEQVKIGMARQMAEVVDFVHGKGVLHRDLKPENFMADAQGRIKLLDLGLARLGLGTRTDARGGAIKGTLAYLPPELLRGLGPQDRRSEYYSLALVLLELFGDRRLQHGRSADELVALIQGGIPREAFPEAPPAAADLIMPYLDVDPARRPETLEPLVKGLRRLQSGTIALPGGEALEAAVARERRAWLLALSEALERDGRLEESFARLKELLELDPMDAVAQARLQELGMRLNESAAGADQGPGPAETIGEKRRALWTATGLVPLLMGAAALLAGWIFYIQGASEAEEMGKGLMEKEMSILSREIEDREAFAAPSPAVRAAQDASSRPAARPYGVLVVTGLPEDYQVLVNRVRYPAEGEIHLPASRYLLEIQDAGRRPVLRDSVTVGGGEPTVYEYAGKAAPPLTRRSGGP